jgi:hypothetical protein
MKQSRSLGLRFGAALAAVLATLASARLAHADDGARGSLIRGIPLGHLDPAAITTRVGSPGSLGELYIGSLDKHLVGDNTHTR